MTENKKRFRKEHIKGTGMQFIVDETTRKENSNGSVGYKAYSTTDMTCDKLVDLLNALHEENQTFEKVYKDLKHKHHLLHDEYLDLEIERDDLKQAKKELIEENQELKEEIRKLDTFKKILEYAEKDMSERADWQAYCEKEFEGL